MLINIRITIDKKMLFMVPRINKIVINCTNFETSV